MLHFWSFLKAVKISYYNLKKNNSLSSLFLSVSSNKSSTFFVEAEYCQCVLISLFYSQIMQQNSFLFT